MNSRINKVSQTTEIIFVRHGETQGNLDDLFHGRTDSPLTTFGMQQAKLVATRLASEVSIAGLYTSPLRRARVTAEIIGEQLALEPKVDSRLTEIDFGELEGVSVQQLATKHPEVLQSFQTGFRDAVFPGGESMLEFHARVEAVIGDLLAQHVGQRIIVVAHGGVIGSGVIQLTHNTAADWRLALVGNCSLTSLKVDTAGLGALLWWNDVAHLTIEKGLE